MASPSVSQPPEAARPPAEVRAADIAAEPTRFVLACMTLPYSAFSLERALKGIADAGYGHVAWGVDHRDEQGRRVPVMPLDAPPQQARELARRCRDGGLTPVMMFSTVYPEHPNAVASLTSRIKQAGAAGLEQVITFGYTKGGNRPLWIERLKTLGPVARDHGVTLVIKQHGGETGTGAACAAIVAEVNDPGVAVSYDAGNVMDYLNVDPIPDLAACVSVVRSFCIKDHRNTPRDEDCGPGLGEIDHYKLLAPVAWGRGVLPLCCENVSAPLMPRPDKPEVVDGLARRAREYLELVVAGLQHHGRSTRAAP